ncbi:ATP-binding protein [Streptomyces sp. NPDC048710]|uniref:ATP-binding protein n=1 Tax=Streptomyces sp. NPDC048710 TaxID=3365586 RepID=UPI00371E0589
MRCSSQGSEALASAGRGECSPAEAPAVPLFVEAGDGVVPGDPAAPRAYGLYSFPGGDFASAPAVRRQVRGTARLWGLSTGVTDDLETITGELVANALEHSDGRTLTVTCALMARTVMISVTDEGDSHAPATSTTLARWPGHDQEQGRGLLITQALANRWGTCRTGSGLTVWAEIPIESAALVPRATPAPEGRRRHTGRREDR